jgi:hypothetical protein
MGTPTIVKLNLVGGTVTSDQNGAVTLTKDSDTLRLDIGSGFKSGAKVWTFDLFEWKAAVPHQGKLVGSWTRDNPNNQPSPMVQVSAGNPYIDVVDVDMVGDVTYCYDAKVRDTDGDHPLPDPELVVKKKT